MPALTEDFAYIVEKFGVPVDAAPLAPESLAALPGKVPQALLDFYELYGQGLVLDGFFQFCDPMRYAPIARAIFGDDPDLPGSRCHIIGFSAFGVLNVWSEDHGTVTVYLPEGRVSCLSLFGRSTQLPADRSVALGLFLIDKASNDVVDTAGKGLFKRARKKLGALSLGQVYGFAPLLSLGGPRALDHLGIKPAFEHLALLAGAAPVTLIDTSTMAMRQVRVIGG